MKSKRGEKGFHYHAKSTGLKAKRKHLSNLQKAAQKNNR